MKKIRVLFVEDEKELVADLPVVLSGEGFEVVGTTSITEALCLFQDSVFDVVLTDIAMPPSEDMDGKSVAYGRETGIEVVRRMQRAKPDVPIVALTVIRDSDIISRMKKVGIMRILNKPTEIGKIAHALKEVAAKGDG